jgi:hypothetical protein
LPVTRGDRVVARKFQLCRELWTKHTQKLTRVHPPPGAAPVSAYETMSDVGSRMRTSHGYASVVNVDVGTKDTDQVITRGRDCDVNVSDGIGPLRRGGCGLFSSLALIPLEWPCSHPRSSWMRVVLLVSTWPHMATLARSSIDAQQRVVLQWFNTSHHKELLNCTSIDPLSSEACMRECLTMTPSHTLKHSLQRTTTRRSVLR